MLLLVRLGSFRLRLGCWDWLVLLACLGLPGFHVLKLAFLGEDGGDGGYRSPVQSEVLPVGVHGLLRLLVVLEGAKTLVVLLAAVGFQLVTPEIFAAVEAEDCWVMSMPTKEKRGEYDVLLGPSGGDPGF